MRHKIKELLGIYLKECCFENYLPLREAVAASPDYAPYGASPDDAYPLFEEGKFNEAEEILNGLFWNFLLNPRMHRFLWFALDQMGQKDKALREYGMAKYCLEAILSTGTGEKERPYLVLHVEDEYDVLEHLGKKPLKQSLTRTDDRDFDVFELHDGSTVWFDISIPRKYLAQRFNEQR